MFAICGFFVTAYMPQYVAILIAFCWLAGLVATLGAWGLDRRAVVNESFADFESIILFVLFAGALLGYFGVKNAVGQLLAG